MASLFNATTINQSPRYFFATKAEGEQDLYTQIGTVAGLSTFNVGITGAGGNLVQIDTMPQINATEFVNAEKALFAGTGSDYLTLSTINTASAGASISIDRNPGSGITCIENYGTNGVGGFEFLSRGVNSQLISTNLDSWMSAQGRPGASAVLFQNGTFACGNNAVVQSAISLAPQTGPGGQGCFNVADLSGGIGKTRWSFFKYGIEGGANTGTNFALGSYNDAGAFNKNVFTALRSDGSLAITNLSTITNSAPAGTATIFPASKTNVEFGQGVVPIAGASNQATPYVMLFSTPVSGLNPNTQSLININFVNSLSTGSASVNYKIGFSTATAYTNCLQSAYVPGGTWITNSPGPNTPIGATNICAMLDSDGLNPDGTGFLYVQGQLSDPQGVANQIYVKKGLFSEATRNAFVWRPV